MASIAHSWLSVDYGGLLRARSETEASLQILPCTDADAERRIYALQVWVMHGRQCSETQVRVQDVCDEI